MKQCAIGLLVGWAACLMSGRAMAANLLLNPGFEASSSTPQNWTVTGPVSTMRPVFSIDSQTKYSGSYALKMAGPNPNCNGKAVQTVTVTGGQTYLFAAKFKTQNVMSVDKSVMIKITWLSGTNNLGYHYAYDITGESNGWFLVSRKLTAVSGATSAEITLEFRWSAGTVWWDDISIDVTTADAARSIKVGTVYCRPSGGTVPGNITLMSGLLDQAGAAGCRIVCLPEGWATCGTSFGMMKVEANTLTGSAATMLAQKAQQYGMYIVSGLYSWEGDTLYNVAVLYDRQGNRQAVYKKVHLPNSEVEQGAVPGDTFPVFTTDFGKIGILICWDYAFPEAARCLAVNGAEIIFCPIWGDIRGTDIWKLVARARAVDNGVYFVTSIYDGHSLIVNPAGDILQESGTTTVLLTATIDMDFNPAWDWIGGAGRGEWKGVWRKDRRPESFEVLTAYRTSPVTTGMAAPKTSSPAEPLLWYTNPATGQITITYAVPPGGIQPVTLSITDLEGRLVKTLRQDQLAPGRYEAVWDRTTSTGSVACDGVYLCRLQCGGREYTQRMMLIK